MLLSIVINTRMFLDNADQRVKLMKPCLEQVEISGLWGNTV